MSMIEASDRPPSDARPEVGPVLITGASGFLGSALVDVFRGAGFPVRILVRATSPRTNLTWPDVAVAEGDMRDPAAVASAMAGMRYLVHAAADYRLWAPDPEEIVRTNRDGTRVLMRAALDAGVERIVYTSSVATIKPHDDGTPADETRPLTPETAIGAYKRSKVVAERVVEEMVARDRLPAVIVNPSTPIGPRDVKPTPTGRIIVEAANGRLPAFVDTGLNLAHVDDVAAGHLLALRRGRIGERYILGGENVLLSRMLADIAGIVGRKAPTLRLPRAAVYPVAFVSELAARVTGRAPLATLDGIRMSRYRMFFSDAKARAELGYSARPYRQGLEDAVAWFRQAGYIR
ncbi:hopanoid-associated sugar epimerase [Methylobacterium nodulans]|uniref:Hopanoid-associated sugar epimerase n=1 Tax=Methylobacterium nodulans (strain LMG 21967 / CNCM I-2342 / ORS 2060) TaxID=460265 RepID=B8IK97_METNO|nr:hopanoid-associated sugar epimerase [Methylobacterium nodulans]ACL61882.1 hopanoid-associated sugar epimerase [Methylobacterium nodulans ORS 2060]